MQGQTLRHHAPGPKKGSAVAPPFSAKNRLLSAVMTWRRPVRHQVVGVHGTDSRGEVPTGGGPICRLIRVVGSGQHTKQAVRHIAIVGRSVKRQTVHVHVTQRHIVEGAGAGSAVPQSGITGGVARSSVFTVSKLVVHGVGIAPGAVCRLVYQQLYAGHDWRRERGPTCSRPIRG